MRTVDAFSSSSTERRRAASHRGVRDRVSLVSGLIGVTIALLAFLSVAGGVQAAPPVNDDVTQAIRPTGRYLTIGQNTREATASSLDPRPTCGYGSTLASVWYKTTPASSGTITIDLRNSSYDTVLSVWTRSSLNWPSTPVACNDNYGFNSYSRVSFSANANMTYFIMVSAKSSAGDLRLELTGLGELPPPANNELTGAVRTVDRPYSDTRDVATASRGFSDPTPSCGNASTQASVWYKTTPATSDSVTIDTFGSTYNTVLSIWRKSGGVLTEVACNDVASNSSNQAQVEFSPTAGTTYYVMVSAYETLGGAHLFVGGRLTLNLYGPAELAPPSNDDFGQALPASARPFTDTQLVGMATVASDDPSSQCSPFSRGYSVWYATTPAIDGTLTIDTLGSDYDTVLSVWTGTRASLSEVACNDNTPLDAASRQSSLQLAATAGTTYFIRVVSRDDPPTTLILNLDGPGETLQPAALALSKAASKYNGVVEARLTGFAPNSPVTLKWPRQFPLDTSATPVTTDELATGTTDGTGAVTLAFRTPLEPLGNYTLTATEDRDTTRKATAVLRVIPRIMFNETSGGPELRWRVYFYGFAPNDRIEVRWHTGATTSSTYKVVATLTVASTGRASQIVKIPAGQAAGTHMVVGKVVGVARSASAPFTLTAPSAAAALPTETATPTETLVPTETPVPTEAPTEVPTEVPTETPVPTEVPNASPVADAGVDQTVVDADGDGAEAVAFDGTGSADPEGSALAYAWSVDGVVVATGAAATVVLPVGVHTVTLTVTDDQGATASNEVLVAVEPAPAVEVAVETAGQEAAREAAGEPAA